MSSDDTIASEALAAAVGGAISSGMLYPLEVLKTRMQADDNNADDTSEMEDHEENEKDCHDFVKPKPAPSNALCYANNLYRAEGISVFFDGMEVSALQSAIEKALYFFAYTALKRGYSYTRTTRQHQHQPQKLSALSNVFLGCLAEWVHLPITLPIDTLTTAIQTSGGNSKTATDKTTTILALWMTLWKEKSFYKGIQAYWILCFKPALQYTIFEQVKAWILKLRAIRQQKGGSQQRQQQLSAAEAFLLGMVSRTAAILVVFPFVRAKVRMQSLKKSSGSESSAGVPTTISIWKLLAETYIHSGWKALYQGLGPELTRGVLSAALMMMVKERISGGVKNVLYHRSSSS